MYEVDVQIPKGGNPCWKHQEGYGSHRKTDHGNFVVPSGGTELGRISHRGCKSVHVEESWISDLDINEQNLL